MLLEQFGGGNGELKAAMQYFVQAFACHNPYPDKYDLLMDIATEELGHLEIVGATIQMLLAGVNGNLKDAAERNDVFGEGDFSKDDFIHQAFSINPQFGVITGGGPRLTDSNGVPWQGSYVNANSDLTVDLRSNIAAESRAKIVYEYLMQFTDDKDVLATLNFLLTREVAHFQQFEAALDTIQPNFPPGVLQSDPRYSNIYSNHSVGDDARGPWNEGRSTGPRRGVDLCRGPLPAGPRDRRPHPNRAAGYVAHLGFGAQRRSEARQGAQPRSSPRDARTQPRMVRIFPGRKR